MIVGNKMSNITNPERLEKVMPSLLSSNGEARIFEVRVYNR